MVDPDQCARGRPVAQPKERGLLHKRRTTWLRRAPGVGTLAAGLLFLLVACFNGEAPPDHLSVLSWNVENLFDAVDDEHEHDDELRARWSGDDYDAKLAALARVLNAAGPPDIIALSEIENENVLNDLRDRLTDGSQYSVHYEPWPTRTEVALLSRWPVLDMQSFELRPGGRPALQGTFLIRGEKLVVFVVHWKSRRGGEDATRALRVREARTLARIVEALLRDYPELKLLVLGDFNDTARDVSLRLLASPDGESGDDLLRHCIADEPGSYVYRGEWFMLDHILISPGVFNHADGALGLVDCGLFLPFGDMIEGDAPARFQNRSGYSDHLPLRIRLRLN